MIELYDYWRSSAAYRVRIALNLKGLEYRSRPVNLAQGEQRGPDYRARNPEGLVPCLVDGAAVITQSLAICEYLETRAPLPALLPDDPVALAQVRAACLAVACDIHPLNNLRVLNYLRDTLVIDEDRRGEWYRHWIVQGFAGLEHQLAKVDAPFCFGATPGLADCFLVPQLYNARRFDCPLVDYPRLLAVEARCLALPAFAAAAPERQPGAPIASG